MTAFVLNALWHNALAAVVPAVIVAFACRFVRLRPATRHTLWLIVLLWFLAPPIRPTLPIDNLIHRFANQAASLASNEKPDLAAEDIAEPPATAATRGPPAENHRASPIDLGILAIDDTPPSTGAANHRRVSELLARTPGDIERPSTLIPPTPAPKCEPTTAGPSASSSPRIANHRDNAVNPSVATAPPQPASPPAWLVEWLIALAGFRDLLARIPAVPRTAWLAGAFVIFALQLLRAGRFLRWLRNATPAPPEINRLVADSAAQLGLRHVPLTMIVPARVSPMVACIGRRRLLLPADLWADLDDDGRRAILFHELAHLHRRDHWVRAIQSIVAMLYWWNPLIWWTSHRLREEAELCCDAWVTWLLPGGRRAYAQALLKTREFLSINPDPVPAVGIGITGVRARRFARRLTMVMKDRSRPRTSALGLLVAAVLATTAWLAAPVWSAPPPEADVDVAPAAAPVSTPIPAVPPADAASPIVTAPDGQTVLVTPGRAVSAPSPELVKRLVKLERELREIRGQLGMAGLSATPELVERPGTWVAMMPPPAAAFEQRPKRLPRTPMPAQPTARADGVTTRTYKLSEGKLEALMGLMSRDDVPVRVRAVPGGIAVEATQADHETFRAFLRMIDGRAAEASEPDDEASTPTPPMMPRAARPGRPAMPSAPSPRARARRAPSARMGVEARQKEAEAMVRALQAHVRDIEREQEKAEAVVEKLQDKASDLRAKADEMDDSTKAAALQAAAAQLEAQASAMQKRVEELNRASEKIDTDMDKISDAADAEDETPEPPEAPEARSAGEGSSEGGDEDSDSSSSLLSTARKQFSDENWQAAASAYAKLTRQQPKNGAAWYNLGFARHSMEQYDQAREAFLRSSELGARKADSLYNIACGYARMNQKDKAFDWLQRAWRAGYHDKAHMKSDDDLENLRDDPRYKAFMAQ